MARILGGASSRITDGPKNENNRFDVADAFNRACALREGPFWGKPPRAATAALKTTKPRAAGGPSEFRSVEETLRAAGRRPFSVWQLLGNGSVGSQALRTTLGIRATPNGWAIVEETDADDSSCAAALATAVLDAPDLDAGTADNARETDGLTVVEHELDGSMAQVTVRKLIDGRSVASRDFAWDLAMPSGTLGPDGGTAPPLSRIAAAQRACATR